MSAKQETPNMALPVRLSVVVTIASDTTDGQPNTVHLAGCLEALHQQVGPPPQEIIVPYYPPLAGLDSLKPHYPEVNFLACEPPSSYTSRGGSREHHAELCAQAVQVARGDIIGLLEDHDRPHTHWCTSLIEAHRQPYAGIGGAVENGIDAPLNWAVYFCDFGRYQKPLTPGPSAFASDVNVAYKREALEAVRSAWQENFNERIVHAALLAGGYTLALSPDIVVSQHRLQLRLGSALRERVIWGRSYGAFRTHQLSLLQRLAYMLVSPLLPVVLLARMTRTVLGKGRCRVAFLKAFPLTAALTVAWSWGELIGYLTGQPNRPATARRRRDRPPHQLQTLGPDGPN